MNPHPLPRRTPGPGRDAVEHRCVSGGAVGAEAQDHAHAQAQVAQAHVAHATGLVPCATWCGQTHAPPGGGKERR